MIFAGLIFFAFGIGSIYSNPTDLFNQRCSFVLIIVGFILILYGIFYKVTISDLTLNYICLIPFRKISLIDVERLKIERTKKGILFTLEYTDGRRIKLSNLNSLNLLDNFIQELENSIYQQKSEDKDILDAGCNKRRFNTLLVFFLYFLIVFSFIFAMIVSYLFILLIKNMQVVKNMILLKVCVIFIFSITFLLFFNVFFFLFEKIKTK